MPNPGCGQEPRTGRFLVAKTRRPSPDYVVTLRLFMRCPDRASCIIGGVAAEAPAGDGHTQSGACLSIRELRVAKNR